MAEGQDGADLCGSLSAVYSFSLVFSVALILVANRRVNTLIAVVSVLVEMTVGLLNITLIRLNSFIYWKKLIGLQ